MPAQKALFGSWGFKEGEQNIYNAIKYMYYNGMLPTSINFIDGYDLYIALIDTPDGQVDINFIKYVSEKNSVDFKSLYDGSNDQCFGECLFDTIYQLIRTSEGYKENDKEAQKNAIKNVLVDGDDYRWFRDGLKTFFKEAKDENKQTAANIDMGQILAQVPELKTMLENCDMELKFEYDENSPENSQLTVIGQNINTKINNNNQNGNLNKEENNNLNNNNDIVIENNNIENENQENSNNNNNINKTKLDPIIEEVENENQENSLNEKKNNNEIKITFENNFENNSFDVETKKITKKEKSKEVLVPKVIEKNENNSNNKLETSNNNNNQTEVSVYNIVVGILLALSGIALLGLSFLAPGVVLPFLTNLLPISTFTAKITLAVVGFGLAVVGGILSVPGIINNIMYKNSPGGAPGDNGTITSTLQTHVLPIDNQSDQLKSPVITHKDEEEEIQV